MAFTARKGSLSGPGIRAHETTLDGVKRIEVDRGTGLLEFPAPDQFLRIAREEHVPKDVVAKAFGHLVGADDSGKDMPTPKRPRSRHVKLGHIASEMVTPGIVKGQLVVYDKRDGKVRGEFREVGGKMIRVDSRSVTLQTAWQKAAKLGVEPRAFLQAFGHMLPKDDLREYTRALTRPR